MYVPLYLLWNKLMCYLNTMPFVFIARHYQYALCTTMPQGIKHKDPYSEAEYRRLEKCAILSAANHDCTGCCKNARKPHHM